MTVSGSGSQTLTGANTYSGATTINLGATLQLGNGSAGNDGTILATTGILDNGTLVYDRSGSLSSGVVISGSGNVTVSGTGSQTLTGLNSYTGVTLINPGATLQLGDGTAGDDGIISNSSAGITDNGTLVYDRSAARTARLIISGSGNVTVSGTGSETLTAVNTYTGATLINPGATLQLGDGTTGHDGAIEPTAASRITARSSSTGLPRPRRRSPSAAPAA